MKQIAYLGLLSFLLWTCSGSPEQHHDHSDNAAASQEEEAHEQHEHDHAHSHHHHDANAYMNQSDFDDLVARFDDPARAEWQQPEKVADLFGDLTGKTVADIGAGTGYFAFPLAQRAETVLAIDIDQRFLDLVTERAAEQEVGNIETRLVTEDAPGLAQGEAHAAIIVNTYHHIHDREVYFAKVKAGLQPGGQFMVVDFALKETPHGPPVNMRIGPEQVTKELEAAGFRVATVDHTTLPYQFILIATAE